MDTKSLAKSKRAHTQHHKKHHHNQKGKATTTSTGASITLKPPGNVVKEQPRQSHGSPALPSNWDRYEDEDEDEDDPMTKSQIHGQSSQQSDVVLPKSKGADYAYLISEAKSQNSTRFSSEIFPSFDDFVSGKLLFDSFKPPKTHVSVCVCSFLHIKSKHFYFYIEG